jgi:uncharacterized protein YciW
MKATGATIFTQLHYSFTVDAEDIRTFLHYNPMFLENYVMKHVDQERLERWLIRKTTQEKRKAIQPVKTTTNSGMN